MNVQVFKANQAKINVLLKLTFLMLGNFYNLLKESTYISTNYNFKSMAYIPLYNPYK